ncbi:hypothetical protein [Arenibacter echinorum]|uniref:Uncharacterized protein n=1 Tax=Arenibacter echinorum TaxID=440515 RepID=A0A327QS89_9FLAO|nr:hypothetical protein [Arenibacter echinorum]RAJ07446.1 hypothetical protein LV92_03795 [Arenibacter echinorum]
MHKVILIILAIVVNELAGAYDESKLIDNCIFYTTNQYSNEYRWMPVIFMEASVNTENIAQYIPVDPEPSWKLFPNFKPIATHCAYNHKMNFQNYGVMDDK